MEYVFARLLKTATVNSKAVLDVAVQAVKLVKQPNLKWGGTLRDCRDHIYHRIHSHSHSGSHSHNYVGAVSLVKS